MQSYADLYFNIRPSQGQLERLSASCASRPALLKRYFRYLKTVQLLQANPHHPSLRMHALKGRLQDLHSVSINLSHRITMELLIEDGCIVPVNIGLLS